MYDWISKTKPIFNEKIFIKLFIELDRQKLIERIKKKELTK